MNPFIPCWIVSRWLAICLCLGLSFPIIAQDDFDNVSLEVDPIITKMVEAHIKQNARKEGISGYRVQIIQDSDRTVVREEKTRFLEVYPDVLVYETYEAPFFKLRVGDFSNRLTAYGFYQAIKESFKRSLVVPEKITPF